MRAMVMAAGRGTRLQPLTDVLPKPALPVANEPVMGHLLRLLARHGIRDIVANIHYRADDMRRVFGDGTAFGVNLQWSEEGELKGTAGGVKNAEEFLLADGDSPFLVLSGDGFHGVDLTELIRRHEQSGAIATLALSQVADPSQYGVALLDDDGIIAGFQEKPSIDEARSNLCNTGIYVFSPELLRDRVPAGEFYDFGNDVFPGLLRDGQRMLGVVVDGYWNDIGGLEAYRDGNLAAVDGRVPRPELDESAGEQLVHPTAQVARDAVLTGPCVVGAWSVVGAGAHVSHSVLLPGSQVPEGAILVTGTIGSSDGLARWADSISQ